MQRICAKEIKGGTELAFISRSSFRRTGKLISLIVKESKEKNEGGRESRSRERKREWDSYN